MTKALIDPNETVMKITEWILNPSNGQYKPVFVQIPNSNRVAQVANDSFPVALPLFWIDCANDVVADIWYFDTSDLSIKPIPPAPPKPTS